MIRQTERKIVCWNYLWRCRATVRLRNAADFTFSGFCDTIASAPICFCLRALGNTPQTNAAKRENEFHINPFWRMLNGFFHLRVSFP
jgi:hypothetical protein